MTEIDAEHENGLCHPFSNTEPEDKGSVSASCFFQHLLDDNSYLSPHQTEGRGERRKYPTHCSSCLFLFTRFPSLSSSPSLFFYYFFKPPPFLPFLAADTQTTLNIVPLPLRAMDLKCSSPLLMCVKGGGGARGWGDPILPYLRLEVRGHA